VVFQSGLKISFLKDILGTKSIKILHKPSNWSGLRNSHPKAIFFRQGGDGSLRFMVKNVFCDYRDCLEEVGLFIQPRL